MEALNYVEMSDDEFLLVQELAKNVLNIPLGENMRRVVTNQLQPVLRKYGLRSFRELYSMIGNNPSQNDIAEIHNILTPDHTFFFRERDHFDFLSRSILPEIAKTQSDFDLRIWCAACSSGEEAYTLAMLLSDFFHLKMGWELGVLATDISRTSLAKAAKGVYDVSRTAGVPPHFKSAFLQPYSGDQWQMQQRIKDMVTFRYFNLMKSVFPFKKQFHAIFCRNVLIYFHDEAIVDVVRKFYDFVLPGGYLFIGASESLQTLDTPWAYIAPGVYQKKEKP